MSMQRVMLIPFFLCFLVMLACPARAAEGAELGEVDAPMDGVILEDPDPDPGYSVDAPSEVPPGDPDPGYSVDTPGGDLLGDMPLDGIVLPEDTVDNTAVLEALTMTNTLLSYIFVMGLYFFVVSVGKLIYSFFNFF